jgi:hypothetical protein
MLATKETHLGNILPFWDSTAKFMTINKIWICMFENKNFLNVDSKPQILYLIK